MCGIYGVLSYKDGLTDINSLVEELGFQSEERGMDATGVAYVTNGKIRVHKQAVCAHKFKPHVPVNADAVIGHTRHSTQGDKSWNYNNHPWRGNVKNGQFALAHNGIITNDAELQSEYGFKSKIQTDSFVAVQLLERANKIDFDSIKFMAEAVRGSYSFNLLDNLGNIYLVKGDSPISIVHFKNRGVYVFASTPHILWRTLVESALFAELRNGCFEEIVMHEGDILKITSTGDTEWGHFKYTESFGMHWYDYGEGYGSSYGTEYLDDIKSVASAYGMDPDTIQAMYDDRYTLDELEDLLYCGEEI